MKSSLWPGLALGALSLLLFGQLLSAAAPGQPRTVAARRCAGAEPVYVSGVVIRWEQAVYPPEPGEWIPALEPGEKAAAGETLFVRSTGGETRAEARQTRLLLRAQTAAAKPLVQRRTELRAAVRDLGASTGGARRDAAEDFTALMRSEGGSLAPLLARAEERLRRPGPALATLDAPCAGVFAPTADGLEAVLTPEDPWAEYALPAATEAIGRLVLGDVWYFRGAVPLTLSPGETVDALLLGGIEEQVPLTVEEVRDGVALFSCPRGLASVSGIRELTVKLLLPDEIGLEIPKETVYTVGETVGVWCLVGDAAVFKPVTVLRDLGDSLLVELDQTSTDSLWPGDEIFLEEPRGA